MVDVKGRWAFITGAARGIGRGAAVFMAERGCNLILQGRTKENCAAVLEEVKTLGVEAYAVGAEFSDLAQVDDRRSGRDFSSGNFYGLTLEEAVKKAEDGFPIYTGSVAYV